MKELLINEIRTQMSDVLSEWQMNKLHEVLLTCFNGITVENTSNHILQNESIDYLNKYLGAKKLEGCSAKTLFYYQSTIEKMLLTVDKNIREIATDDLRCYLSDYHSENQTSMVTIDNIRRILSGFFAWLEDENYIIKSPARRIHKVKTAQLIKETFSDENIESMRNACTEIRDLVLIEFLASTGVRIGELVLLNRNSINFYERSCIVLGKGNKQREVYFDAKTKLHLQEYLLSRNDDNEALFVSLNKPHQRLTISGIEKILQKIGKQAGVGRVYPHKFRRSLATMAIDKGMPIEQVQKLLGHVRIDTTMHYAMVNQSNVKMAHRRYIG